MSDIVRFFDMFGHQGMELGQFFFAIFVCLAAFIAVVTLIGKISQMMGKPVKWVRTRAQDHKSVIDLQTRLLKLQEQQNRDRANSIRHDEKIQKRQEEIYKMLLNKDINDRRWQIMQFATGLSEGKHYRKEQYEHIIEVDTGYERILKHVGLSNGQTDSSMVVIRKKYEQGLENGFNA